MVPVSRIYRRKTASLFDGSVWNILEGPFQITLPNICSISLVPFKLFYLVLYLVHWSSYKLLLFVEVVFAKFILTDSFLSQSTLSCASAREIPTLLYTFRLLLKIAVLRGPSCIERTPPQTFNLFVCFDKTYDKAIIALLLVFVWF